MNTQRYEIGNLLELFLSLCYGLTGWYLPRHFMRLAWTSIVNKDTSAVYQTVGDNEQNNKVIIVDFLLNQPLVDPPTIPSSILVPSTVWLPLLVALVVTFRRHCTNAWRPAVLRTTVCAWATAVGTSEGLTQIFKLYVQRRRPNFLALCGFQNGKCTSNDVDILEANLSFPSGHSSLTACGMTFLTLVVVSQLLSSTTTTLSTSLSLFHKRWTSAIVALAAFCYTILVGTSRIVDQWHHPSDVVAGWLLGALSSAGAFHFWFPSLTHPQVGVPWTILFGKDGSNISVVLPATSSPNLLLSRTSTSSKAQSFNE